MLLSTMYASYSLLDFTGEASGHWKLIWSIGLVSIIVDVGCFGKEREVSVVRVQGQGFDDEYSYGVVAWSTWRRWVAIRF
ncbi:hypothetical protein GQ457_10G012840 [Hibiscus cannabinus]